MAKQLVTPKFLPNGLINIYDLSNQRDKLKKIAEEAQKNLETVESIIRSAKMYNDKLKDEKVVTSKDVEDAMQDSCENISNINEQ